MSDDGLTVVGIGRSTNGTEAWRVRVDAKWVGDGSGSWDGQQNWAFGINPNAMHDILIQPATGLTVTGPATNRTVNSLVIGAQSAGVAELRLQASGRLHAAKGITVGDRGRLSGAGHVESDVDIQPGGELAALGGDRLHIDNLVNPNRGRISALGGEIALSQTLTNDPGGQINIVNGSLTVAVTSFFTDLADWQLEISGEETLVTTAANVGAADEVASPPADDEGLGKVLNFQSAQTGLSRSFRLTALEPGGGNLAGFIFNDHEGEGVDEFFEDALSVGDKGDFHDDDWQVEALDGPALFAFGLDMHNNGETRGESLSVFGPGDVLLGTLSDIPDETDGQFLGVVTHVPVTRIEFDEGRLDEDGDDGDGDIAISDFRFATVRMPVGAPLGLANLSGAEINAVNGILNVPGNDASDDVGLTNLGTLTLANSTVNGDVHSPAGSTLNLAGAVTFNGIVSGGANFDGGNNFNVLIHGGYSPGDSAAEVAIGGNLAFADGNTLYIEIGGTSPGTEYDVLTIAGVASLDGALDVTYLSGFAASPGDFFPIIDADSLTGAFDAFQFPDSQGWYADYDTQAGTLTLWVGLPGDTNADWRVNIDDLNNVRNNFGATGPSDGTLPGDAVPFDGLVNIDDLNAVRNNFGAVAAVPEPAGATLAVLAALMGSLCLGWRF